MYIPRFNVMDDPADIRAFVESIGSAEVVTAHVDKFTTSAEAQPESKHLRLTTTPPHPHSRESPPTRPTPQAEPTRSPWKTAVSTTPPLP